MKQNRRSFLFPFLLAVLLTATGLLSACSDDEPMKSYWQDLLDVETDDAGYALRLFRDNGDTLQVTNSYDGLDAGTTFRAYALYVKTGAGAAEVSQITSVFCAEPRHYTADNRPLDPIDDIISAWRGSNYLNLCLSVLSGGGSHGFGFHMQALDYHDDSDAWTARLLLIHSQGDDEQYYTRTFYLCCDLSSLTDILESGRDSISLTYVTAADTLNLCLPY